MKKYLFLISAMFLGITLNAQEYARILNHSTTYNIIDQHEVEIEESYSIQINSEEGRAFGVYFDYMDDFRKLKDLKIEVKDMNGKRVKRFSKGDVNEYGFSASYEIDDSKRLYLNPDYQNYPFIVEVSTKVQINGFISLPGWVPRTYFNLAVDQSSLDVVYPKNMEVKFREEHINPIEETTNGDLIVKKYEVKELPHIDQKMLYKEFYNAQPKVFVSPLKFEISSSEGSTKTWKDFGNWFYDLNDVPYTLNDKTKSFIDQMDKSDTRKVVRDIYRYMQDKTRYISIQLGIGGFKSIPTETVEASNYGDCKGLSTYMKNMLDYAGISSNYILVKAGKDVPDVVKEFPSFQFNHVFIGVPLASDTIFLECTSQQIPYDYNGTFTDDRNVLWIAKDNSKLIRSRTYTPEDNIQLNKASIDLDQYGNGIINLDTKNHGVFYDDVLIYKTAKEDYIKRVNNNMFPYKDFTISDFTYKQPERDLPVFDSQFTIKVNGLGRQVSDKLLVPANALIPVSDYIDYSEFYNYAEILRGITIKDEVEINLKNNFWAQKLPETIDLKSDFGYYKWKVEADSEKIIIKREFQFKKGTYTKGDFDPFLEFIKSIEKVERQKIVLNSKT